MKNVVIINSSGNKTALINNKSLITDISKYAKRVISSKRAEQVATKSKPKFGGDCRLDMLGGEFCGNAIRGYGYYYFINNSDAEAGELDVEISGVNKPLKVYVDAINNQSYVSLPIPTTRSITNIRINFDDTIYQYPLVKMPGIAHVLVDIEDNQILLNEFDNDYSSSNIVKDLIVNIMNSPKLNKFSAVGIMFINNNKIYPYVEVKDPLSKVWESSCGSGTSACYYYILNQIVSNRIYEISGADMLFNGIYKKDGDSHYFEKTYIEPGGNINLRASIKNNKIKQILMGGSVTVN